jgi:nickel/cobalt transporter (NicO) family protein
VSRVGWTAAFLAVLLAAGGGARPASAHPHVFVDYAVVLAFEPDGRSGAEFTWTYDELSSSLIVESLGSRSGRALTQADVRTIERTHFQPLKAEQYFLDIRVDGTRVPVSVKDFRATLEGDQVRFVFTVPITAPTRREGALEIRVDDPTYYVAFEPRAGGPVRWSAPPGITVGCTLVRSSGSFESDAIRCTYRRTGP